MASVYKRTGSSFYWASITLPNGNRRKFTTKSTDRAVALEIAHRAEAETRRARTESALRSSMERIVSDVVGPPLTDPLSWFSEWLAKTRYTVEQSTFDTYATVTREAGAFLKERKVASLNSLTTDDVVGLRNHWGSLHAISTTNLKLKVLRIILRAAWEEGKMADLVATKVDGLKKAKNSNRKATSRRRPFTTAELNAVLDAAEPWWQAVILLGLYTGQRMSDFASLRWSQVDLAREVISFETDKTGAILHLPIPAPLLHALSAMPSTDDPHAFVFPKLPQTRQARSTAFARILVRAGLKEPARRKTATPGQRSTRREVSALSFHSLRHTATTMLKDAGVSDAVARAIIGHESEAISRVYTHLPIETLRAAMEKMPLIGRS